MNIHIYIYITLWIFLIIGCGNNLQNTDKENSIVQISDTIPSKLPCIENLDSAFYTKISINPHWFLSKNDTCITNTLDIIEQQILSGNEKNKNYFTLNIIYKSSDGAISEYFIEIASDLFHKDYSGLSEYLYLNREKDKLKNVLIEALSIDISESENPNIMRMGIVDIIKKRSKNNNIKKYMLDIEKEIDPKYFD